jgi:hypothetical protein
MNKAIISADVINSKKLSLKSRKQLPERIEDLMNKFLGKEGRYSMERGDFIQVEVPPAQGLSMLLLLKTRLNSMGSGPKILKQENKTVDIRISLGIGNVDLKGKTVGLSDGPAYQLSGRGLDQIKSNRQTLIMQCEDKDFNEELRVMAASLEFITNKWTKGSAEIISLLIEGKKEMEIAEILKISQSAVNQRKKTAGWEVINMMLQRYEMKTGNLK